MIYRLLSNLTFRPTVDEILAEQTVTQAWKGRQRVYFYCSMVK